MSFNKEITINNKSYLVHFSDEEVLQLKEFYNIVKEIQSEPILSDKFSVSLNIAGSVNKPMKFDIKLPDSTQLSVLLHKMRPLILKQERTYLHKIIGMFAKKIDNTLLREHFKMQSGQFQIDSSHQAYHIKINDKDLVTEETFFLWLNAYEYHRDINKIEKLEPIIKAFGKDFFTAIMINILIDKFNAIQKIASFVEEIIVHGKTKIEFKERILNAKRPF